MSYIQTLLHAYDRLVSALHRWTDGWAIEIAARLAFASVLFLFFITAARTKIGPHFWQINDAAYIQIFPGLVEAHGYDIGQIDRFPYNFIVWIGSYSEFVLPVLIVLGLFTRLASMAMIGFVCMISFVDIYGHHVDAGFIGRMFDKNPQAPILDQRLLWVFLLFVLVLRGGGIVSADHLLGRFFQKFRDGRSPGGDAPGEEAPPASSG